MQINTAPILLTTDEGKRASEIARRCVHCGFCNTTCPTFDLLGDERDGPRGRIYLIKELLETNRLSEAAEIHLDRCLTCRSCETTCPSGVEYGELLEFGRHYVRQRKSNFEPLRWLLLKVLPNRRLLRLFVALGRKVKFALPAHLQDSLAKPKAAKSIKSSENASVVLLQGCVQQVLTPDVVVHLSVLLKELDVPFRVVKNESCCGSLHLHTGDLDEARKYMARLIDGVKRGEQETVISTASGCGVTLKDFARLLPNHKHSEAFVENTKDIAEFLSKFEFRKLEGVDRVAFHSPCTLQHGQSINGVVEKILRQTGYDLVHVRDSHLCCGSAGTYSILHPELSNTLRENKIDALQADGPDVIATANIGCQIHLGAASSKPVLHWIQLLRV